MRSLLIMADLAGGTAAAGVRCADFRHKDAFNSRPLRRVTMIDRRASTSTAVHPSR